MAGPCPAGAARLGRRQLRSARGAAARAATGLAASGDCCGASLGPAVRPGAAVRSEEPRTVVI